MTFKNIPITIGFAVITASQLGLGICLVVFATRLGGATELLHQENSSHLDCVAQQLPPIPLEAFRLCVHVRHRTLEMAYTSISLFYGNRNHLRPNPHVTDSAHTTFASDFLAFSLIVLLAVRSKGGGLKIPTLLRSITKDATRYFLVIFTSHFVLVITLNLGRVSATFPLSGLHLIMSTIYAGNDPTSSSCVSRHLLPLNAAILILLVVTSTSGNLV